MVRLVCLAGRYLTGVSQNKVSKHLQTYVYSGHRSLVEVPMKNTVVRTAVIAAAITTVLVTAITLFALPKVPAPTPVDPVLRTSKTPEPVYDPDPNKPSAGRVVLPSDVRDNSVEAGMEVPAPVSVGRRRSAG